MQVKISLIIILLSFSYAQTSISGLNRLNNTQLDEMKEALQSQEEINRNEEITPTEDFQITSVEIQTDEDVLVDNRYFGYNYFNTDINFFDNIPTPSDFRLGAGDEIILSLWGEVNSREKFIINKEGLIYYKSVGFINVSNKTIEEAEVILTEKLSRIYSTLKNVQNPTNLMLELGKLKSLNIYFSGEIAKPGIQLVHPFSDMFVALIQAGGINLKGTLRNIQLIRNDEVIETVDLYKFFSKGSNNFSSIRLIDGDIIHVPVIQNRVQIRGSVLRPGFYEMLSYDNINDLISYAAGFEASASSIITVDTITPIEERTSQDNIISSTNLDLKNFNSFTLNNGDVVTVRSVGISNSKVEVFGRVKVPGTYSAKNMSLKDILDIAGGFDDPVFRKTIKDDEIIILRRDENEFYSKELKVSFNDAASIPLEINDKIFVYEDINYRNSFTYRVEGEVFKPGTYPINNNDITVGQALSLAGGFTDLSSIDNVIVFQEYTSLDDNSMQITNTQSVGNITEDFILGSNTVIRALPFENVVKVEGNVYDPGLVAFSKGLTMYGAIVQAGGYKPYSMKKRAYVRKANGKIDKAKIFRGRSKRLNPGDTVIVPIDPNPSDIDITSFVADMATTFANIAAILLIVDNQND